MRDLDVRLDAKLNFISHVEEIVSNAKRALRLLIQLPQTGKHLRSLFGVKAKSLLDIYCANIRPILKHGCVVWGAAAKTHQKRK